MLDRAGCTAPTLLHELGHTDQDSICPEISSSHEVGIDKLSKVFTYMSKMPSPDVVCACLFLDLGDAWHAAVVFGNTMTLACGSIIVGWPNETKKVLGNVLSVGEIDRELTLILEGKSTKTFNLVLEGASIGHFP